MTNIIRVWFPPAITVRPKLYWAWVGVSRAIFGASDVFWWNFTLATPFFKPMTISSIWQWCRLLLDKRSIQGLLGQWRGLEGLQCPTQFQGTQPFRWYRENYTDWVGRYFKGTRLDYPNDETTRASKKYVHAMKLLPVGITIGAFFGCHILIACI